MPIPVPPVVSAPSTPSIALPPVAKASASRLAGTLKVTLNAKDVLSVLKNGKRVVKLPTGTYNVIVSDKSRKRDVTLRRIGGTSTLLTGRAFKGTKKVSIDLVGGQWKIYSAAREQAVFAFFRVTKS